MNENLKVGCMSATPIFIAGEICQDCYNGDPETGFKIMTIVENNLDTILNDLSEAYQNYCDKGRLDLSTSHDIAYGYLTEYIASSLDNLNYHEEFEEDEPVCIIKITSCEQEMPKPITSKHNEWAVTKQKAEGSLVGFMMNSIENAYNNHDYKTLTRLSEGYPELYQMFEKHIRNNGR